MSTTVKCATRVSMALNLTRLTCFLELIKRKLSKWKPRWITSYLNLCHMCRAYLQYHYSIHVFIFQYCLSSLITCTLLAGTSTNCYSTCIILRSHNSCRLRAPFDCGPHWCHDGQSSRSPGSVSCGVRCYCLICVLFKFPTYGGKWE